MTMTESAETNAILDEIATSMCQLNAISTDCLNEYVLGDIMKIMGIYSFRCAKCWKRLNTLQEITCASIHYVKVSQLKNISLSHRDKLIFQMIIVGLIEDGKFKCFTCANSDGGVISDFLRFLLSVFVQNSQTDVDTLKPFLIPRSASAVADNSAAGSSILKI